MISLIPIILSPFALCSCRPDKRSAIRQGGGVWPDGGANDLSGLHPGILYCAAVYSSIIWSWVAVRGLLRRQISNSAACAQAR
ncbi:hypothetical protein BVD23_12495 [Salmonella enterica]|nr:hypothetical protein [Salmonella enterica]EBI7620445.1 hypothetical protein [Salmonella enterica]EBI8100405.1 hypothetical protein [Salmonella enterica]EBK3005592.1 hypothetical protein [Salmonella enterica]EBK9152240.1 hypothetical protein [Salmonella enterica]